MKVEELLIYDGYVTIELDAIGFCGYNNSVLWDPDYIWDMTRSKLEINGVKENRIREEDIETLYSSIDVAQYKADMNEVYMGAYIDCINMVKPIIEEIEDEKVKMVSPQTISVNTDEIYQRVRIDMNNLKDLHQQCCENPIFENFIERAKSPDLVLRSSFAEIPSLNFEHWRDLEDLNMRELNILLHLSANLYNASLTKNNINKECEVICVESYIEPTLYIDPEVLDKMVPKHSVKKHEHIFNKSSKLATENSQRSSHSRKGAKRKR